MLVRCFVDSSALLSLRDPIKPSPVLHSTSSYLPKLHSSVCCGHVSPFPLLFFALSDMSQDSSDEELEEEEEEDFSGVQFGSRYQCQCVLHTLVLPGN